MNLWTIYDHPIDFPDKFVARRFENSLPTSEIIITPSLDELRDRFEENGLVCVQRHPHDDPKIIEVWI